MTESTYPSHLTEAVQNVVDPQPCVVCGSRLDTATYGMTIYGKYVDAYLCQRCPFPDGAA